MVTKRYLILSFLIGFVSIIAQALILRAFQVVFYGNELSYAVLLSAWLFWVGAGSLLASAVFSVRPFSRDILTVSFYAVALGIPGLVFGVRYIKPILETAPGQMIGLAPMAVSGMILTAPVGFFIGVIFALLCRQVQDKGGQAGEGAGTVYFFESCGSAAGGMVFSFFLLRFFNTTMIAWIIAAVIFASLFVFYRSNKTAAFFSAVFFLLMAAFIGIDALFGLNVLSYQKQWPFGRLAAVTDSPYANIAVVEREGQISFYQNGMLSFTSPDLLSAEGNVHVAMLAHPYPRRVLLIGGGLGGELNEILKYADAQVDFVEIDAALIEMARAYLPPKEAGVLDHPRVTVHAADARFFVRTTNNNYDVIIVNAGDPYTSGMNRFYTLEFFGEIDRILDLGGVLSLRVSSSENYLNDENRLFLRSLNTTLKQVFPGVRSIPGGQHTFLASNITERLSVDTRWMIDRLRFERIDNRFVNEHTLPFILDERRINAVEDVLSAEEGLLNTDLFPRAYLYSILLWASHFGTASRVMFDVMRIPFWAVLISVLGVLSGIMFLIRRRRPMGCVDAAVVTTGFSEIIFEIVVILAFQSLYGVAYDRIGFILAAFMMGLVVGSRWAVVIVMKAKTDLFRVFQRVQFLVVLYPLMLPVCFGFFRDAGIAQQWVQIWSLVFAFLPFIAGLLGGLQYPLASALRRQSSAGETEAHSGGVIYALDAFGASAGALVTGIFLIPVFGITAVCFLCAAVNGIVLIFLKTLRH